MPQEEAIHGVVDALETAINRRDWDSFVSHFATDADAIVFEGPRADGREATREMLNRVWAEIPTDVRASLTLESVRLVTSEVAVANLDAECEGSAPFEDRATLVLSRRGNEWQIEAFRVMQAQGAASPSV